MPRYLQSQLARLGCCYTVFLCFSCWQTNFRAGMNCCAPAISFRGRSSAYINMVRITLLSLLKDRARILLHFFQPVEIVIQTGRIEKVTTARLQLFISIPLFALLSPTCSNGAVVCSDDLRSSAKRQPNFHIAIPR